ncbi:hypothetical protein BS78_09G072000 [Paspalum vaginatum]|nr:hypothetical protein BS78_09G072000 [Paspalum vaginatum]
MAAPGAEGAAAPASHKHRSGLRRVVDGLAVDQAVAYVLMAAALAVTYLLH